MATHSILNNVTIKDKHLSRTLVYALENAERKKGKTIVMHKTCETLDKDQIKQMFGADK